MRIVIFGLSISSSWGNGHATLWRSLVKSMLQRGHTVVFYEKDVPYYAAARDVSVLPHGGSLRLYSSFAEIRREATHELQDADLALCTSFCPDASAACELILMSRAEVRAFYDLDTPVTLNALNSGGVDYLPAQGLSDFDVVLSYTGGRALAELKTRLGARYVAPLYGSADPETHLPTAGRMEFLADLSYLGTYAEDRRDALEALVFHPAKTLPDSWFLIGGSLYPADLSWPRNVGFVHHVAPPLHPAFFSSCRATLNITRQAMARYGFCPSGRLFEAAACGAPLLSDWWEGLDLFFTPDAELLVVRTAEDVRNALAHSQHDLRMMAVAARERTLAEHTGAHRVMELEHICELARSAEAPQKCA